MSKMKIVQLSVCCILGLFFVGCGGHTDDAASTPATSAASTSAKPAAATGASDAPQMAGEFGKMGGQSAAKK